MTGLFAIVPVDPPAEAQDEPADPRVKKLHDDVESLLNWRGPSRAVCDRLSLDTWLVATLLAQVSLQFPGLVRYVV